MATQKPWMVHYLKETAVTFFGILMDHPHRGSHHLDPFGRFSIL